MSKHKGSDPKYGVLNRSDPSPTVGNSYDDDENGPVDVALSGFRNQLSPEIPISGKYLATVYRVEGDLKQTPSNGHLIRPENILHSSIHKESYATARSVVQLRIHIPELMPMLPAAPIFPTPSVSTTSNSIINTYPLVLGQTENLPIPSVGEKVWVEFQNIYDLKTGLYVAPYKTTRNNITNKISPTSPKSAFDDKRLLASADGTFAGLTPEEWGTEAFDAESLALGAGLQSTYEDCEFDIPSSWKSKVEKYMNNASYRQNIYDFKTKLNRYLNKDENKLIGLKSESIKNIENPISNNTVYSMATKKNRLITSKGEYSKFYDKNGYLLKNVECIEGIGFEGVTEMAEEEMQFWLGLRDSNIAAGSPAFQGVGSEKYSKYLDKKEKISDLYDANSAKLAIEVSKIQDQQTMDSFFETNMDGGFDPYSKKIDLGVYDPNGNSIKYRSVSIRDAVDGTYRYALNTDIGSFQMPTQADGMSFSTGTDFSVSFNDKKTVVTSPGHPSYNKIKAGVVENTLRESGYDISYTGQYTKDITVKDGKVQNVDAYPLYTFDAPQDVLKKSVYENPPQRNRKIIETKTDPTTGKPVKSVKNQKVEKSEQAAIWDRLRLYWTSIGVSFTATQAWSAAFISYILRNSGFIGATSHARYIRNHSSNIANCVRSGWYPFSLLKNKDKITIQVGDVLVKPRIQFRKGDKGDYIGGGYSHGDVVYKIEGGKAYLCGGNTADTRVAPGARFFDTAGIPHVIPLNDKNKAGDVVLTKKGYVVIIKRMHEPGQPPDGQSQWYPNFVFDEE
jgi:hypothetical protein